MDNKVLVTLYVPYLEKQFDMYIPVNKRIHVIIQLIKRTLFELSEGTFEIKNNYELYSYEDGMVYDMNSLVRNTDIRNNSRIIIV